MRIGFSLRTQRPDSRKSAELSWERASTMSKSWIYSQYDQQKKRNSIHKDKIQPKHPARLVAAPQTTTVSHLASLKTSHSNSITQTRRKPSFAFFKGYSFALRQRHSLISTNKPRPKVTRCGVIEIEAGNTCRRRNRT